MSFTNPVDLPKIPSLPPIEMPDTAAFLGTSSPSPEDQDSLSPLRPSVLSAESYITANSSLSVNSSAPPPNTDSSPPSSGQLLAPPTNLRKSISVDSFIKYRHLSSPSTRPNRGSTTSSIMAPPTQQTVPREPSPSNGLRREHSHPSVPVSSWREGERLVSQPPLPSAQSRGASMSSFGDDRDYQDESDMERSDDLRRDVAKRKSMARHNVRDGELTLPSRMPPPSSSAKALEPIVPARSSSLSHRKAKQRVQMSVNTRISPSHHRTELVIAVVGASGSGRTTVIRKGLKSYALSDVKTASVTTGSGVFNYSYRIGRIVHDAEAFMTLRVLEIDIASLDLNQTRATQVCPDGVPPLDALVICYDASQEASFTCVSDFIRAFAHLGLPSVVLACKSDLEKRVDPHRALSVLKTLSVTTHYDVGLVETTTDNELGKQKIRMAFEWIFQTLLNPEALLTARDDAETQYNPASPAILSSNSSPWEINRAESATPTASSSFFGATQQPRQRLLSHAPPVSETVHTPTSPARARSTNDLLSESRRDGEYDWDQSTTSGSVMISVNGTSSGASLQLGGLPTSEAMGLGSLDESAEASRDNVSSSKESRTPPWVSLQELLNKLLFLAVSDDDATFISHFLLTYRRFASPRSILLAMQKRMRALDEPLGDPMFACFAQMKICCLLDTWMHLYPTDFAVPGTAGALSALLKSILGKTYLLQYGSEFIPFMELLPTLDDKDAAWAMKVEDPKYDSDDSSSFDAAADTLDSPVSGVASLPEPSAPVATRSRTQSTVTNRDRKSSLPLSNPNRSTMMASPSPVQPLAAEIVTHKAVLKKLQMVSSELNQYDPTDVAQEITRHESELFVLILPRHWMQHVLGQGKKDNMKDPIAVYNRVSNHIAHWVLSLILCHDKPKARAKQIERFADIANRLRNLNNYSALRAVVAGINGATFEGDEAIDIFKTKNAELWKVFQSFDHLLQAVRSHQRYRMALRNTSGACIPALEIHLSDLIRAHEGNPDFHDGDPEKIHWAKFNMMGRFIDVVTQCQKVCVETKAFKFQDRPTLWTLLMFNESQLLMDEDLQRTRTSLPDIDAEELARSNIPRTLTRDYTSVPKDSAILRKIFFW
ncbi:hypothetical protein EIP91_008893 [Steccherinum ochraceum]|uniref:Ras GEF n=1 Tax=Steccherinum ochraceum TaxID=92696 RepID=A0A4R0RWA8_9APHY|nr:hypothetical protein EIP91_008893 [Steccherinum ochraceum]